MKNYSDPFKILTKEHEASLSHLERMSNAVEHIRVKGFSYEAFVQISKAIRFIGTATRSHNQREEKYLLPLLDLHANGTSRTILYERREIWRAYHDLLKCVEDIEEGRVHARIVHDLVQSATSLIELLSKQIARENEDLFPQAMRLLTPMEYHQLSEQIIREESSIPSM
jgi:hemerythrin-like domain-containing protein